MSRPRDRPQDLFFAPPLPVAVAGPQTGLGCFTMARKIAAPLNNNNGFAVVVVLGSSPDVGWIQIDLKVKRQLHVTGTTVPL